MLEYYTHVYLQAFINQLPAVQLTKVLGSIFSRSRRSSDKEYLASPVM